MELKDKTRDEIDQMERERNVQIKELRSKAEKLTAARANLLFQLASGGGKDLLKEVEQIEKEQKVTEREIEIHQTFLKAVSGQRNRAWAVEIEEDLAAIEDLNQQLIGQAHTIDQAAELLVLETKKYYHTLSRLYEINPYALDYRGADVGVLDSIGVYLRKHGLWKFIKVGHFRDAKTMTEKIGSSWASKSVTYLADRMRDHIQRLRGEVDGERNYCTNCYAPLHLTYSPMPSNVNQAIPDQSRRFCSKCREIDD